MTTSDARVLRLLQDARQQLESERLRRSEPIAIVGMGCRFPGGASSPATFWKLLTSGLDATGAVPVERWDAAALYDSDRNAAGKCYVKRGGFLERIDEFEPEFFGISAREAERMDPQQRLLLEVAWEALQDAGIVPGSLAGGATGVWIGLGLDDYARLSTPDGRFDLIDAHTALGNARSVAAGRIAYVLGVHGPTLQLDAACSSSLVAVHLACQSLRSGECEVALAGAASLMSSPEATVALCRLQALSADGRSKTFDASADGYGRGEGCGVVVLKTLSAALAAGDGIYSVIRGSAVNHDGRSNGLTAPNGLAQEAVIRTALANSGIEPTAVGYVEAHGTGTQLGDPIEVLALNRVYGVGRGKEAPLYIGSVKTNLGHSEAASGMAALIKTALCVWHEQLVPHLHCRAPNPKIPWSDLPLRIAHESTGFRAGNAGVHSFGISGTNAHVILGPAPLLEAAQSPAPRSHELVILSAKTEPALRASAARLREHLGAHPEFTLLDLAYSLATTRSMMAQRLVLTVSTREDLVEILDGLAASEAPTGAIFGRASAERAKLAWLFPGSGTLETALGQALSSDWPVFRDALAEAFAAFDPHLDTPLRDVIWAAPGTVSAARRNEPLFALSARFVMGWALSALWRSWGVEPDYVAGHSVGELCAGCVAGIFSLSDSARLVVAQASSSLEEARRVAESIAYRIPSIPLFSQRSGKLGGVEVTSADFWVQCLRLATPVSDRVEALQAVGVSAVVEMGCQGVLLPMDSATDPRPTRLTSGAGRTSVAETRAVMTALGSWLARGGRVDFRGVFSSGARRIRLPTYPFQRQRYWLHVSSPRSSGEKPTHPLGAEHRLERRAARTSGHARRRSLVQAASARRRFAREFARSPVAERIHLMTDAVRQEVARVLAVTSASLVPLDVPLRDLGLDSLLATELGNALARRTGFRLSADLVYGQPTVRRLAELLIEHSLVSREITGSARLLEYSARQRPDSESQFQEDGVLDPAIRPIAGGVLASDPASVLLSGATGFLGAYLLHDLLRGSDAHVTCLVRAVDSATGIARIVENLRRYGLWDDAFSARFTALVGDLREPQLGLDRATFDHLAHTLDAIYNNGAVTGFIADYRTLKSSHVNATNEILRLASAGRCKAVHHISSTVVFDAAAYRRQPVAESTDPLEYSGLYLGYSQAKWVSESLVRGASSRGLPVTIHRPGFIAGSSLDGAFNSADFLARMLQAIVEMGVMPGLEIELDFSPVDYVSRSIVYLSRQPSLHGRAFHLQHPHGIPFECLGEILRSLGYQVRHVAYWDWVAQLETRPAGPLAPLLPFLARRWGAEQLTYMELWQRSQRPRLTCHETLDALRPSGIECAALDRQLIGRYLQHLLAGGVMDRGPLVAR